MWPEKTPRCLQRATCLAVSRLHQVAGCLLVVSFLCFPLPQAFSQESIEEEDKQRIRIILLLIARQAKIIQEELKAMQDEPETRSIIRQREKLQSQLDGFNKNFEALSTQLSTDDLILQEGKKKDWITELQELTLPLLEALSDISEKPRKIEKYKKDIAVLKTQLLKYEGGTKNLLALMDMENSGLNLESPDTQELLDRLQKLKNKYDPELVDIQLEETERNLNNLLDNQESIVDTIANTMRRFFKSRGLNLLIAFMSFVTLWWVLIKLRSLFIGAKRGANLTPWIKKLMMTIYNIFVIIICLIVSMVTLYLRNDWLLLSVIILFLVAVAWTSRQLIPKLFREVRLGLNLGTVREGERLIWGGVPWYVSNIGLQATLVNERLEGGHLNLPLGELIDYHSRPVVRNEPWFPTQVNDWVVLSDGTYGKVENQTIEQIVLRLKGDALKFYATPEFLKMTPVNISMGFRYDIQFGLDYGTQSRICDEIPQIFEDGLRRHMHNHYKEESPDFLKTEVTFDSAGSSSLNLRIIIHVDGRRSEHYEELQREVQTSLVRICNENGLVIPFTQLTLNLSEDLKKLADVQNLSRGKSD